MIETTWIFLKRNAWPQSGRILATTHPYLSGLLAGWVVGWSDLKLKPFVLANFFVPYDTVVFGFTATAVALSIAIPNDRFIKFLSQIRDGTTPFRNFLFILAWNGIAHIAAFFMLIPFIFLGDETVLKAGLEPVGLRIFLFFALWVQFYACLQFMVTTIGVYELADLYGNYCASLRKAEDRDRA